MVISPTKDLIIRQAIDVLADIGKREINKTKTSMEICQCAMLSIEIRSYGGMGHSTELKEEKELYLLDGSNNGKLTKQGNGVNKYLKEY